jgi:hypothetical protein
MAAQKDQATAASYAVKRPQMVSGDFDLNREDGSENFSDLGRFGDAVDFVSTLDGMGEPVIHGKVDDIAYILWLFFGEEAFTAKAAGTSPPKYIFKPGTVVGKWSTWWKRVGLNQVVRQQFNSCKITSVRIECSTANKLLKITPTVRSLNPGLWNTADPTSNGTLAVSLGTQRPLDWALAKGTVKVDGVSLTGQTQFAVTLDNALEPVQTDSATYGDFVPGKAKITMDGPSLILDDKGYNQYLSLIYGTTSPAAAATPLTAISSVTGSYEVLFTRGSGDTRESLKITIPGLKWNPNLPIAPNPDGGAVELSLQGEMRKVSGSDPITITVETGAGDNAAHTLPA